MKAPADTVAWGGARISGDGSPEFQVNGAGAWVKEAIVSSNDQLTVRMTAGNKGTTGTATLTLHSGQTTGETTDTSTWGNGATVMQETNATFELTSNAVAQTITNPAASPTAPVYAPNGTFTVSATAGASTSPLSYSSQTTSICTVPDASKNIVTMQSAGDCTIAFDQAGDSTYAAAPQVTLTGTIAKAAQTLSFSSAAPTNAKVGDNYTATTNSGGSTSTGTLAVAGNCSLSVSTVIFDAAGSCTVTASQLGDANYLDATSVTQTIPIGKANQTLAFSSTAPTNAKVGGSYSVTTTSGKSTSLVTLAATGNCSLAGSTVSLDAYGSCSVTASQKGDANYLDAPDVTQTFSIAQSGSGVNIISTPNPSQPGQDVMFSVSVSLDSTKSLKSQNSLTKAVAVPTGTVTLTDSTTTLGTATLDASGNATLTVKSFTTVGTHSIVASYSGDANYPAFQSAAFTQTVSAAPVATPVPLFGELWEKLLLSLMVVSVSALCLLMRRAA
ncbi:Ig-like domain-containing protein [Diaphorobacter sp. HDW4B]|uniref:Ig-like domain-containing protein n=1 Tax=Diaphorobacter sp. HDW4B TaxID=2714925 RepID=UPI001F0F0598|nr:Ig-like domain-containing protein [Diaphorobacter sp. HDW4B]